jgi:CrcB protein
MMNRWSLAAVALGGALGTLGRWAIDLAWPQPPGTFPGHMFMINVTGCAAIGVLMAVLRHIDEPPRLLRPLLGSGLLGGFTTFSTYAVQTRDLAAGGHPLLAVAYLGGTLATALAAVWLGMLAVRLWRYRTGGRP